MTTLLTKLTDYYTVDFFSLRKTLLRILGSDCTLQDVLHITPEQASTFSGFGLLKCHKLSAFQAHIKQDVTNESLALSKSELEKPNENQLSPEYLDKLLTDVKTDLKYRALISKIIAHFGEDLTLGDFFQISLGQLEAIPYFGKQKVANTIDLQDKLAFKTSSSRPQVLYQYDQLAEERVTADSSTMLELPTDYLDKPLFDLKLDEQYHALVFTLQRNFGRKLTVGGFLQITLSQLEDIPYFGRLKVAKTIELQNKLALKNTDNNNPIQTIDYGALTEEQLAMPFSKLVLAPKYKRLINQLKITTLHADATIKFFLDLQEPDLIKIKSLGRKKISLLKTLQQEIVSGPFRVANCNSEQLQDGIDDVFLENEDILDIVFEELDDFLINLNSTDSFIFRHRYGFDAVEMTLEEIGKSLPNKNKVTRERVRQLQKVVEENWLFSIHPYQSNLWVVIQDNLSILRKNTFINYMTRFENLDTFYDFISFTAGKDKKILNDILQPRFDKKILDNFWVENKSPVSLDEIILYVQEQLSCDSAIAENAILILANEQRLYIDDSQNVKPKKLSRHLAFAHAALYFRNGASWEEIQRKCKALEISSTEISIVRLDGGIGIAVDLGFLYQTARGGYRHTKYLELSNDDIDAVLNQSKELLENANKQGVDTLNVMTGIYNNNQFDLDYFHVRHILRTYGDRYGMFFNGKSGADSVSLEKDFSPLSQKNAILSVIQNRPDTVTRDDIAKMIRSGTTGHAAMYIDQLVQDRSLVYVGNQSYNTPEKAFKDIHVEPIFIAAAEIIEGEARLIEASVLQRRLNRKLKQDYNKHFYLALLNHYKSDYGCSSWFFSGNFICRETHRFSSLAAVLKFVMAAMYDSLDNIDYQKIMREADKYILLPPKFLYTGIRNTLRELRLERANQGSINAIQASADFAEVSEPALRAIQFIPFQIHHKRVFNAIFAELREALPSSQAVSWLLALCTLRYMDVHGLHSHGLRVLPSSEQKQPEVLQNALELAEQLDIERSEVEQLILKNDDTALYNELLIASLKELKALLPDLYSDLLDQPKVIFDDPLNTRSLLMRFSQGIDEQCWLHWLVFDEIHSFIVKEFDISVFSSYPSSLLYATTGFEQAKINLGIELNVTDPMELRIMDYDCGSGAYSAWWLTILFEVYAERGFRKKDILRYIFTKNLFAVADHQFSKLTTQIQLLFAGQSKEKRFFQRFTLPQVFLKNDIMIKPTDRYDFLKINFGSAKINFNTLFPSSFSAKNQNVQIAFSLLKPKGVLAIDADETFLVSDEVFKAREYLVSETNIYHINHINIATSGLRKVNFCNLLARKEDEHTSSIDVHYLNSVNLDSKNVFHADYQIQRSVLDLDALKKIEFKPFSYWLPSGDLHALSKLTMLNEITTVATGSGKYSLKSYYWFEIMPLRNHVLHDSQYWLPAISVRTLTPWYSDILEVTPKSESVTGELLEDSLFVQVSGLGVVASALPKGVIVNKDAGYQVVTQHDIYTVMASLNSRAFCVSKNLFSLPKDNKALSLKQIQSLPLALADSSLIHQPAKILESSLKDLRAFQETSRLFKPSTLTNYFALGSLAHIFSNWKAQQQTLMDQALSALKLMDKEASRAFIYYDDNEMSSLSLGLTEITEQSFIKLVISFFVGSSFGRYSADAVKVIPIVGAWFSDDIYSQFRVWLKKQLGEDNLEQNIRFCDSVLFNRCNDLTSDLSASERYFYQYFIQDHTESYLGSPIYLHVTSGRLNAFQALVYVHNLDVASLAQLRQHYVLPLIERYSKHAELLPIKIEEAQTVSENLNLQQERKLVSEKIRELHRFDERLNHAISSNTSFDALIGSKQKQTVLDSLFAGQ